MDTNTDPVRAHDELRVQAALLRTQEFMAQFDPDKFAGQLERIAAALARQPAAVAPPPGDGCHCGTCTCNPNMTPAVRFDLSPAQMEGAIRDHLIALGWTPPNTAPPPSAPPSAPAGVDWPTIVEGLREADHFFDGDDRYWPHASKVRAAYRAALAAQQQGDAE